MREEKQALFYEHFFCRIEGVGLRTLEKLFRAVPDREYAYGLSENHLEELLGEKAAGLIGEARRRINPEKLWEQLQSQDIRFASYWSGDYPHALRRISDAPKALYAKGNFPGREEKRVAIIGARACSEYGRRMAQTLGEELADNGVVVVSGMARGIDGISQRYALEAGGTSYGVLGCGVDICYPKENRSLYEKLIDQGGVLSEYVPGTAAKANLFPPRNRIISALSDAVVVVEARRKSGTIITVDMALEQGKEVLVVPGRVGDGLSEGCNDLLRQGAAPVLETGDILRVLGMEEKPGKPGKNGGEDGFPEGLSGEEGTLYRLLDEYPRSVEELARELLHRREEMDYADLCQTLLSLCRKGLARAKGNTHFVKVKA